MSEHFSTLKIDIYPTTFPLCFNRLWKLCFQFPNNVPENIQDMAKNFLISQASQEDSGPILFHEEKEVQKQQLKLQEGASFVQDKLMSTFKSTEDLYLLQIFDHVFRALTFLEEKYQKSLFQRTYTCTHYNHHVYLPFGPAQKIIEVMHKNVKILPYDEAKEKDPYYSWTLKSGKTYLQIFRSPYSPFGKKDIPLQVTYRVGYAYAQNLPVVYQNIVYELIRFMVKNGGSLPQEEEVKSVLGAFPLLVPISGMICNKPSNDPEISWFENDWA